MCYKRTWESKGSLKFLKKKSESQIWVSGNCVTFFLMCHWVSSIDIAQLLTNIVMKIHVKFFILTYV